MVRFLLAEAFPVGAAVAELLAGVVAPAAVRGDLLALEGGAAAVPAAVLVGLVAVADAVAAAGVVAALAAVADAGLALGLLPEAAVLRARAAVVRAAGAGL